MQCNASPSHTWGVISLPSAVTVTCKGRDSCTSSNDSLSIILLSPTTWTGSRGYPRTELAFLMSLSSLLLSAAEMLLLHTAEKMADAPTESLKEVRSAPCTQKDTSFLSRWSLGLRGYEITETVCRGWLRMSNLDCSLQTRTDIQFT